MCECQFLIRRMYTTLRKLSTQLKPKGTFLVPALCHSQREETMSCGPSVVVTLARKTWALEQISTSRIYPRLDTYKNSPSLTTNCNIVNTGSKPPYLAHQGRQAPLIYSYKHLRTSAALVPWRSRMALLG